MEQRLPVHPYVPLVEVTRGEMVESVHYGAFSVVDREGHLLASAGDPDFVAYPRSALKPLQVLAFIEAGGDSFFDFTGEDIAIMCASHAGTDAHSAVLQGMQQKIGITDAALACGTHWPYDAETRDAMKLAGQTPTTLNHNCSGKHSGMLAFARMIGASTENYLDLSHPVQIAIRETIAELVAMAPNQMPVGIDGCSAPVYGIPMLNMAWAVAKMADPGGLAHARATACRKITAAMMAHPLMVAGPGQFDTDLMTEAGGKVFCKGGAEGYLIMGVMPGVLAEGSHGIGIAIKIADGDALGRARSAVGLTILQALGVLDEAALADLQAYGNKPLKNWRGLRVGAVRASFDYPDFSVKG